jgi:hypothetical protein
MASNLALLNSAGMSIHFNFERIPWCRGSPGSGQLAASAVVVKHELFDGQSCDGHKAGGRSSSCGPSWLSCRPRR